MGLFRRTPPRPPLPLLRPRLGGDGGWPDPREVDRSFAASTLHELGTRRAFDDDARRLGQELVDRVLTRVRTDVSPEDAPHLRGVLVAAARTGAGLGLVDASAPEELDRATAAALWLARGRLPAMPEDRSALAAWCLLAGHWAARTGPSALDRVLADLDAPGQGHA